MLFWVLTSSIPDSFFATAEPFQHDPAPGNNPGFQAYSAIFSDWQLYLPSGNQVNYNIFGVTDFGDQGQITFHNYNIFF